MSVRMRSGPEIPKRLYDHAAGIHNANANHAIIRNQHKLLKVIDRLGEEIASLKNDDTGDSVLKQENRALKKEIKHLKKEIHEMKSSIEQMQETLEKVYAASLKE